MASHPAAKPFAETVPMSSGKILGGILAEERVLSDVEWAEVAREREETHETVEEILIRKNLVGRETLLRLMEKHFGVPFTTLPDRVDVPLIKLVPENMIGAYQVVPLALDSHVLTLGMTDPRNTQTADRVAAVTGFSVKPRGILESDFRRFYVRYFEDAPMLEILRETGLRPVELDRPAPHPAGEDGRSGPVTKLLDSLLTHAARKRASDIHVEPQEKFALVRFRIDGQLHTQQLIARDTMTGLVSRVKVLAEMDITERRVPLDGKFRCAVDGRGIDVRVSTIPSRYGEKLALRVLDRRSFLMSLDLIGMPPEMQKSVEGILARSSGFVLVTGPTGSGKTTTLYALVQKIRSSRLNILTLEDPIEYELLSGSTREGGITQIQVNPDVGLSFSSGLRACLRQDPDVIFVGEIRDRETAETAISASLTGHVVMSSLHTNGAVQTVARLLDMGVEPYLIVSSLRAVVSQRLVRALCHQCKLPYHPPQHALDHLDIPADEQTTFYKPQGCDACAKVGYWGRTGVFEFLPLGNELNPLILQKKPQVEIYQKARDLGFRTLKEHGVALAAAGVTSLEEVLRVLPPL